MADQLPNRQRSAPRQQALRERRMALGLKRLEVYAHPDDHDAIRARVAELQQKREKVKKA